ncbi:hypothetical protein KIN20_012999, partial [Parelaphostrongylus tenuis]
RKELVRTMVSLSCANVRVLVKSPMIKRSPVRAADLKKRIASLMEEGYLRNRCDDDPNVYQYVA